MAAVPTLAAEAIILSINSAIKLSHNIRRAYAHSIRSKALVLPLPDFNPNINLDTVINFFERHPSYLNQMERLEELHEKADRGTSLSPAEREEYLEYYRAFHALEQGGGPPMEMDAVDLVNLFRIRQWEKGKAPANVLQLVAGTLVEIGIDYFTQVPGALNMESAQGRVLYHFLGAFDEIDFADNPDIKKDLSFSGKLLPRLFAAGAESVASLSAEIASDEKVQAFIKATAKGIANDIYGRASGMGAIQRDEAVQWGQMVLRSMVSNAGQYVFQAPQSLFGTNQAVSQIIESSGLALLDAILDDDSDKIAFRKALSPDLLDQMARATLSVVAEHPNVLSGQRGIKEIISGVAAAVQQEEFLKQGFLPELTRIVLEQSAGRLELLWRETPNGAEHLLVSALSQVLSALSEKQGDASWRPMLTKTHLLGIVEELVDDVAHNPAWIIDGVRGQSALAEVLEATFSALRTLPKGERLNAEVFRWLIRHNMQTALTSHRILDKVHWGSEQEETVILTKALEMAFTFVFPQDTPPGLNRMELLTELLGYTSETILRQHPDRNGLILLDLVLFNSGIDYSQGFDAGLANQFADAALAALASQPELAAKPEALRHILAGVAGALDSAKLKQPALIPRLVQLVLQNTALNAHLVVGAEQGQPKHLLVTALAQILPSLAAADGSGRWKPGITPAQVGSLIERLLDETVRHPFWITSKVNQDSLLAEVLDTAFQALSALPQQERLTPETFDTLIQLSLRAAASSPRVLQKVHFADDEQEKGILLRALELVFAFVYAKDSDSGYRLYLLSDLLDYILEVLMSNHPDKKGLILADLILFEQNGIDYAQGFRPELANQLADSALRALAHHPELAMHDQALRHIVADVAGALQASGLQQPGLLSELIRLTLDSTAGNLDLLWDVEKTDSKHLLTLAVGQVLKAIAQPAPAGKWKPRLSNEQVLEITGLVYDTVLENPQWVREKPLLFLMLEAVFLALQGVPTTFKLPYVLLRDLIDGALEAANRQRELLVPIQTADGIKQLRLQYALEGFVVVLYHENGDEEAAWQLSQGHIVNLLADYYLAYLSGTPAQQKDLDKAQGQIRKALELWKKDYSQSLAVILDKLGQLV